MRRIVLTGCFLGSLALGAVGSALAGCSSANGSDSREGPVAAAESAIAYGTTDSAHTAVVALLADAGGGSFSECSGTIVQVKNGSAYVLTAAHCCNMGAPSIVVMSNDYTVGENYIGGGTPVAPVYAVTPGSVYYDTKYDGQTYDFCMFKVAGVPAGTPVIPVAQPGQDGLALNVSVEHVGFGVTNNNQNNSGRRTGTDTVDQGLDTYTITYSQGGSSHIPGPCEGDSGGPALMPAGAAQSAQKVVATTSYGNSSSCSQGSVGVSMRVTSETGPNGFITHFLANTPSGTPVGGSSSSSSSSSSSGGGTCQACEMSAESGACANQTQACGSDQACITLNNCLGSCQTQACINACASTAGAAAVAEYQAFVGCICNTACTSECATDCGTTSSSSSSSSGSASTTTSTSGGNTTSGGTTATSGNSSSGSLTTGNGATGAGNGAGGGSGAGGADGTGGGTTGQKSGCSVNAAGTSSDPASGAPLAGLLLGAAVAFARRRRAS